MAKIKDPASDLADKLVEVLRAQRGLGAAAYPPTLHRLIELAAPQADSESNRLPPFSRST